MVLYFSQLCPIFKVPKCICRFLKTLVLIMFHFVRVQVHLFIHILCSTRFGAPRSLLLFISHSKNCSELLRSGQTQSGVYSIDPDSKGSFDVYCDMRTDGGGWTVFQRRQDGSVDFYRGWNDYKSGFGQLTAEFWLGNDKIHRLTASRASSLRVELEDWNGVKVYDQREKGLDWYHFRGWISLKFSEMKMRPLSG